MEKPSGSESLQSSSSTKTLLQSNNRTLSNSGSSPRANQVVETVSTSSSSVPVPAQPPCSSNVVRAGLSGRSNAEILEAESRLKSYNKSLQKGYNFAKFAMTEDGSRMVQNLLMRNGPYMARYAVERVTVSLNRIPLILHIMINEHGSKFVPKIIEACNDEQLQQIVQTITWESQLFVYITRNRYGSRVVRELIDIIKQSPLISMVVNGLARKFFEAMTDRFGSSVVLYCFSKVDNEQNSPLYEAAIRECVALGTHRQGCLSLNNFIDDARGEYRDQLLDSIAENAVLLSQDDLGNYVVQKVLGLEIGAFTAKMSIKLRGHYANLSMQQGGSHVVERILESPEGMENAVTDLVNCGKLVEVTQNRFGNYVIQTALKVAKQADRELYLQLLKKLEPHFPQIQNGYAKNVYNLIVNGH